MSSLRISGLASGMDTDEMIKSLMKVERLRVDKYEQDKQVALWRQEIYNNLNKDFANFILNTRKELGLITTTSTGSYMANSYSKLNWVKKANSSNENIASVSGTSTAINGNFELEVKELAKGATFVSANVKETETFGNKLTLTLNGEEITVENGKGVTMNDIVRAINSTKIKTLDGNKITDEEFKNLDESKKKLVKDVSIGVTAFYDKENGKLFLQTTETGAKRKDGGVNEITLASDNNGFIDKITGEGSVSKLGQDAKVFYNDIELNYSTNRFNINNIEIEAKSIGTTTITVDTNVDGMIEKIEKLVNDYNELLDKASNLMGEKRYSNYRPLTAEEKKAMDKDDIKLWEEKAKSGLIRGDSIVERTLQTIRNHLYENVEGGSGSFKLITSIGITTEKYSKGSAGGKLQIDKDKLRQAILQDPEGVLEILFKEADYSSKELQGVSSYTNEKDFTKEQLKAKREQSGIFTRIYDDLIYGMQDIIVKSGSGDNADLYRGVRSNILLEFVTKHGSISSLDKDVLQMDRKIDDMNGMLVRKENAYYAKFANMEKMLQQMYSQSNWLSQQFMR